MADQQFLPRPSLLLLVDLRCSTSDWVREESQCMHFSYRCAIAKCTWQFSTTTWCSGLCITAIPSPVAFPNSDGSVETGLASVDVLWAHVLRFAPHMTVMGEIAISVALLLAAACRSRGTVGRLAAKTGVSLALLLHLGTARCVPNHTGRLYSGITAVGVIGIRCLLAHNTSRPPFQELR
eukprot:scaffold6423_cov33-Tisochrysis_lutea.AAC.5